MKAVLSIKNWFAASLGAVIFINCSWEDAPLEPMIVTRATNTERADTNNNKTMGQTGKKTPRAPANSSVVITTLVVIAAVGLGGGRHGSHLAHAYSEGAPDNACSTMRPLHGASKQAVPSPYSILLSSQEVLPSQILTVTLNGSEFKGFMVTAFASDFRLGTMIAKNDTAKTICDNLSITHTSQVQKTEVTFDWMAPDDLLEGTLINFVATMVKERLVYWMDVVQLNPLVGVETPPDLPIEGGGTTDGTAGDATITESVPTGVLPTPGTAAPVTTPTFVAGGNSNAADANAAHSNQFPGHLHPDSECARSKACFHDCHSDGTCTFIISWRDVDESLSMTFTYRLPGPQEHWIAVGFSKDQQMGDDSVTECIMDDGKVIVQQSYNNGMDNNYLDNKQAAISEATGSVENGILSCSFLRKKSFPRDPMVFDLNDDYFLLVATGEGLRGNKMPHTFDVLPPVSDHLIDLQSLENVAGEEPPVPLLIKLHGALMMIGWVMLSSLGIMTAKYGKPMFPNVNPCGANIWFQIHRGCMLAVTVLTLAGVVLMFVQCEGYCQIPQMPGKSHWPLHPPLGLLVLILTLANPIMAFFRPGPKAPNRVVLNWSHWGVGVLAWIMASFTVLIGLTLERAQAPPEALYVMVVWGVYHILILVAMETLPRPLHKLCSTVAEKTLQRGRVYNLERAQHDNLSYQAEDGNTKDAPCNPDNQDTKKKEEEKNKELTHEELKVQRLLLMVHYGVVAILTFTLLLVVYFYNPPDF